MFRIFRPFVSYVYGETVEGEAVRVPVPEEYRTWFEGKKWEILPYPDVTPGSIREYAWTIKEGLREYYQNFLDEMEEVTGKPIFYWKQNDMGTWIWDYGRGVIPENWFGRPGKPEEVRRLKPFWARGRYGQGMKYGSMAILCEGYNIFMWSKKNNSFYSIFLAPYTWMGVRVTCLQVAGTTGIESPIPGAGTVVLIYRYRGPMYLDMLAIPEINPDIKIIYEAWFTEDGISKPHRIIEEEEHKLYCRNILVGKISEVYEGAKSNYSYDLWWIDLEPTRRRVDMWSVGRTLGQLLSVCDKKEVWEKILRSMHNRSYIETHAVFEPALATDSVKKAVKEAVDKYTDGRTLVILKGLEVLLIRQLEYLGYKTAVPVNRSLADFLIRIGAAKSVDEVIEAHRGEIRLYEEIPFEQLPMVAQKRLIMCRLFAESVANLLARKYAKVVNPPEVSVAEIPRVEAARGLGSYVKSERKIYIDAYHILYAPLDKIICTMYHELAHFVDHIVTESIDEPPSRERMIEVSSAVLYDVLRGDRTRQTLASLYIISTRPFLPLPSRIDYDKDIPLENPVPIREPELYGREAVAYVERVKEKIRTLTACGVVVLRDKQGRPLYLHRGVWVCSKLRDFKGIHPITKIEELYFIRFAEDSLKRILSNVKWDYGDELYYEKVGSIEVWLYAPWLDKFKLTEKVIAT